MLRCHLSRRLVALGGLTIALTTVFATKVRADDPELIRIDAAIAPADYAQFTQTHVVYVDPRVARIAERLQAVCPRKNLHVRVVQDPEVNAVCHFGGMIYVNSGLLEVVGADDDALAAVIGHEMGHATRYHAAINYQRNAQPLAAPQSPAEAFGQQFGSLLGRKSASRDFERQADNDSIRFMAAAGFDCNGALRMFDTLDRLPKGQVAKWFRDHPSPGDRRKRLIDFMDKLGIRPAGEQPVAKGRGRAKPIEVRISADPDKLRLSPGEDALVKYRFRYGKVRLAVESRSGFFTTRDGTRLSEEIGPYATTFELPEKGEYRWDDLPRLPTEVAEKALAMKTDRVVLHQSFQGRLPDGTAATWTTELAIQIKGPKSRK